MAAFGILTALRHRDRTGEGQLVDVSMFDGALSWLAMVAARVFAAGERPRRGHEQLGGSLLCYRPYRCADGWVTLGALEPKFWRAWCAGVGREDLVDRQFDPPGLGGPRRGGGDLRGPHAGPVGGVRGRARLLPGAGARARGGARLRARARARDGAVLRAARAPARCAGSGSRSSSRPPPARSGAAAPPSASTRARSWPRPATTTRRWIACRPRARSPARPRRRRGGPVRPAPLLPGMTADGLLKMGELAGAVGRLGRARSSTTCARGCSATARASSARRGTWPTTRRPSSSASASSSACRRSAHLPLRVIREQILERALAQGSRARARARAPRCAAATRSRRSSCDRLADLGVLSPTRAGHDADDLEDHRGDRPLPRGRLRRGARLHGLRHAALPRGAGAARRGGGPRRCWTGSPARSTSTARPRSSPRAPSRCASSSARCTRSCCWRSSAAAPCSPAAVALTSAAS